MGNTKSMHTQTKSAEGGGSSRPDHWQSLVYGIKYQTSCLTRLDLSSDWSGAWTRSASDFEACMLLRVGLWDAFPVDLPTVSKQINIYLS